MLFSLTFFCPFLTLKKIVPILEKQKYMHKKNLQIWRKNVFLYIYMKKIIKKYKFQSIIKK